MATSVKSSQFPGGELHADKVVIVTGPSIGSVVQIFVLGAVVGAAAASYWRSRQAPEAPQAETEEVESRTRRLLARSMMLARRIRDLVAGAAEVAGPALQRALAEGKAAARAVEEELEVKPATEELEQV